GRRRAGNSRPVAARTGGGASGGGRARRYSEQKPSDPRSSAGVTEGVRSAVGQRQPVPPFVVPSAPAPSLMVHRMVGLTDRTSRWNLRQRRKNWDTPRKTR